MEPPVFIVSTGRCGSTMMSDIARLHPKLLSLSEFFVSLSNKSSHQPRPRRRAVLEHPERAVADGEPHVRQGLPGRPAALPLRPQARFPAGEPAAAPLHHLAAPDRRLRGALRRTRAGDPRPRHGADRRAVSLSCSTGCASGSAAPWRSSARAPRSCSSRSSATCFRRPASCTSIATVATPRSPCSITTISG